MTKIAPHILLVGCGKMGGAMLSGWIKSCSDFAFTVLEPNEIPFEFPAYITHAKNIDDIKEFSFDFIILATKPQSMDEACISLEPLLKHKQTILSIAAGKSLKYFEKYFSTQGVIRTMPNLPATIGRGVTLGIKNARVDLDAIQIVEQLLAPLGLFQWIDDEELMDVVTAVSGSGPAYLFHLIETLAHAGEENGLPSNLAHTLARETIIGAALLADADKETSATTLRENVTSKGGTTEAALKILMDVNGLQELMNKAVEAATHRSKELS